MTTWLKAISKIGWDYCFNLIVLLLHVMVVGFSGNGLSNTELGLPLLSHSLNISWRVSYKIKWIINCFNESRTVFQKVVYVLKVNIIVRLYFKSWHQKLLFWGLTLSLPTQAQQSQAIRTPLHAHTHTHMLAFAHMLAHTIHSDVNLSLSLFLNTHPAQSFAVSFLTQWHPLSKFFLSPFLFGCAKPHLSCISE